MWRSAPLTHPGAGSFAAPTPTEPPTFRQRVRLLLASVAWLAMMLALVSRRADDPGFSTSGGGGPVANWLGLPGAWAADVLLVAPGVDDAHPEHVSERRVRTEQTADNSVDVGRRLP